jgi:hypothetical protein
MKNIEFSTHYKGFALGFAVSKWAWGIDLGFWYIGGEW